jgi:signal peptidase II
MRQSHRRSSFEGPSACVSLHGLQTPGGADPLTRDGDHLVAGPAKDEKDEPGLRPVAVYSRVGLTAAIVVLLDQLTKSWAVSALADGPIEVISGVLRFRLGFNSGGAFGLFQGLPGIFLLTTSVVIGIILFWIRRIEDPRWLIPLGMVLGGGLGNLFDRVFREFDGRVVDFIDFRVWPIFNLADTAIVIGVLLVVLIGWRSPRDEEKPPAEPST